MERRGRIPVSAPHPHPLPSYWHIPKSPLANHTSHLSTTPYDYAIVGSGISGTLIAYNLLLSAPSASIVMLEAREACGGATGRNGGHTKAASYRTYLEHREELGREEALKIARLEYANILATHALARELGIECESNECNTVDLIYDEETFVAGRQAIETLRADAEEGERKQGGMAWYEVYGKEDAMKKFWVGAWNGNEVVKEDERLVGAFEYRAGRINAYKFTTRILEECVKKGLALCTNTPVHAIEHVADGNGPIYSTRTADRTIRAHEVILATNGYTPYLLKSMQGAIVPLRGQITAQRPGKSTQFSGVLPTTYSFIYKTGYEYMISRPLPGGEQHMVIGGGLGREPEGGVSEFGTTDDSVLNGSVSKYLHGSLAGYFGSGNWGETSEDEASKRIAKEWTGIMGATADGRPYVGPVPAKSRGVWISAGFNGHGMVLCLKSAEALVHMVRGGEPEQLDWYPTSFIISQQRLSGSMFSGRTDMKVPETQEGPIAAKSRL
ncbi:FAD dependent oxidoreductase-like protein [Pleomassaria siparia CBS 279.74]|uniref:FAD dependent oxidoreductase-like protein n=1 Tax=Pleomassaria siparia CBS 279.74 TaxID=1314801 RepID=A0A6G1K8I9_9PLEO|nr:FAD dependent oxidoreductase-like protein [Pleomassaria siparia CBS 279.74]